MSATPSWPISESTFTHDLPHEPEADQRLRDRLDGFAGQPFDLQGFAGLPEDQQPSTPRARRQLKLMLTVTTDLPEHRVRALANCYAELLCQAVGSQPVKVNVTPLGKRASTVATDE